MVGIENYHSQENIHGTYIAACFIMNAYGYLTIPHKTFNCGWQKPRKFSPSNVLPYTVYVLI